MNVYIQNLKQFLSDEKELLNDLALDVANANTSSDYYQAKNKYDIQVARVSAIEESINLASYKRLASI